MKKKTCLILIFAACFVFFLPYFIKPQLLTLKDNDLGRTFLPLFEFIRSSIVNFGQIPFWDPRQMMGQTFIGNPLVAIFYPLNILFIILPTNLATIIFLFCDLLFAAVFTFVLAKSFHLSNESSLLASLFYAFSTKILLHLTAGHVTMISAFAFFPLAFLSIRKLTGRTNINWIIIGAVSLSLMLISYFTIFYYAIIFLGFYLLSKLNTKPLNIKEITRTFAHSVIIVITTLGLSAIVLIPQIEFGPFSTRSMLTLEDVAVPVWNLKRFLTSLIFPYLNFKSFDHESFLYLGLVPTILSLMGFWKLRKKQKFFILGFGLLTLLFVAGRSTFIFPLAYKLLPILNYSRVTTRLWFIVALIAALLSAYFVDSFKNKKIIFILIALFLSESILIFNLKWRSIPQLSESDQSIYHYLSQDKELFRVYCTSYCFNPQLLEKYQIQTLNGETPIQGKSLVSFLEKAGNYNWNKFAVIFPPYQIWQVNKPPVPNSNLLAIANVKYVASTYQITNPAFIFINRFENIYLYKNAEFLPRTYFLDSQDSINVVLYTPNRIVLEFKPSTEYRNIILSENFYPGWYEFTNYQKYSVLKNYPVGRLIMAPPNSTSTELKYQPESFTIGKTTTFSTIIVLLLFYIKNSRKIRHG